MTDENRKHQEQCCKKNFFESMGDTISRAIKDPRLAPEEVVKERMEICAGCDFYNHNKCDLCGCVMTLATPLAAKTCPHDPPKWTEWKE